MMGKVTDLAGVQVASVSVWKESCPESPWVWLIRTSTQRRSRVFTQVGALSTFGSVPEEVPTSRPPLSPNPDQPCAFPQPATPVVKSHTTGRPETAAQLVAVRLFPRLARNRLFHRVWLL